MILRKLELNLLNLLENDYLIFRIHKRSIFNLFDRPSKNILNCRLLKHGNSGTISNKLSNFSILKCKKHRPLGCIKLGKELNCQTSSFITSPIPPPKKKEFSERRILGYSMEQIFDVVADVEKYSDFLPWCQSSIVKSKRKGFIVADMEIGVSPILESYTSSVTITRPHFIRAESTQGKLFSHLVTLWKFSPGLKSNPQSCIIDFYVAFEFRSSFQSHLANVFFNELVNVMAEAFFKEAKNRYGKESIPSRKITVVSARKD